MMDYIVGLKGKQGMNWNEGASGDMVWFGTGRKGFSDLHT